MIASSAFVDAANCTAERIRTEDGIVDCHASANWSRTSIPLLDLFLATPPEKAGQGHKT